MTDPWEQQLRAFEADPTEMQRFMDRLVFDGEMDTAEAEALRRAALAPGQPSNDPIAIAFEALRARKQATKPPKSNP